jgi:glutathione S-transferase
MREAMPVNTRGRNRLASFTPEVERDLDRVREIWSSCIHEHGGPWLLGDFGAADIMFAPVATRLQTYDVPVAGSAREYYRRILDHPLFVEWLNQGKAENSFIEQFELPRAG